LNDENFFAFRALTFFPIHLFLSLEQKAALGALEGKGIRWRSRLIMDGDGKDMLAGFAEPPCSF
jgi:hypothetical protein